MKEEKEGVQHHVAKLADGRSVVYSTDMFKNRWKHPMFVEPRKGQDGTTYLHFLPFCEFGDDEYCEAVGDCHVLVKYAPSPDVTRIYNLFLVDFLKAREQAKAAREAAASQATDNVTPMATAKVDR